MTSDTNGFQTAGSSAVAPGVSDLLKEHEQENSLSTGKIVDIATISKDDTYENFSIDTGRITNASQQQLKRLVTTDDYQDCIALAVELKSGDVFVDFYTYKSSPNNEYPSVESLAMTLGVDISSVHHLMGKNVDVSRQNGHWVICETVEETPGEPTVEWRDYLNPLAVSGLLTPLGVLVGWQTSAPIIYTAIGGVVLTFIAYAFLLYLTLASKRDYPLPGILGRIFAPDYSNDAGYITEEDDITTVEHGEFTRLHTLAEDDELENDRAVLHNLAIDVTIPPTGKKTVPVPAPATGWDGTTVKGLVYTLSPSVETLDRATGELIPLTQNNGRIEVDKDRLDIHEPRELSVPEKIADEYVKWINTQLGVDHREDVYH